MQTHEINPNDPLMRSDAVAEYLVPLHQHFTQVDPDAKVHAPFPRQSAVSLGQLPLDFDRASDCLGDGGEFRHQGIAFGVHHPPIEIRNSFGEDLAVGSQGGNRSLFVLPHEAGIADHVGHQDG